ncbi:glycosyltransferase family 2 protein [Siccirubricoccus phaeus]|uniref:glycosyltransferase family 2 protein n=1 Tax=Siccirubricoccus phaeus TaxID=2595053 RepID=UPI0011F23567|nr:glycosyltransferase family 2 protein [Siccirubricoccus phaeus]
MEGNAKEAKAKVGEKPPQAVGHRNASLAPDGPKAPIGALDLISDEFAVCGWAWNEAKPTQPASVNIHIDGEHLVSLNPQEFRADLVAAGISHGCFAFQWQIPHSYHDGKQHEICVFHADHDRELPGSPISIELPTLRHLADAQALSPFVNPDLALWPNGLQGPLSSPVQEITPGLVVALGEKAGNASFMVAETRPVDSRNSSYYGVRIEAEHPSTLWIHHRVALRKFQQLQALTDFSLEVALGAAEEVLMQRPCEIWLTRQTNEGFEKLRRLSRGRIFRRPTLLTYAVALTDKEQKLAAARVLHIGLLVERCRSVRFFPAQIIRPYEPPSEGFASFEDVRLAEAFEKCSELARANSKAELFNSLLPPLRQTTADDAKEKATFASSLCLSSQYPFTQIVVPAYNGDSVVVECLKSIQRETTTPFQAVIINDGSRKHTREMLRTFVASDPRFIILDRTFNKGYTKSINEAVKATSAEWVVILNSDTVVSHGWLAKMHDAAMSDPDAGMVGPLSNAATWQSIPNVKEPNGTWSKNEFIEPDDVPRVQSVLSEISERGYPSLPLLNGFCTLIHREVFRRCGLYDEDAFPIGYGEETDLCLRATKAGFKLLLADDCFVYHRKSVTFGTKGRKPLSRAGSMELMNKHVGTSTAALEQIMQDNPTLTRVRSQLADLRTRLR